MAGERDLWLSRYAALRVACGAVPEYAGWARDKAASDLVVLTLEEDEAVLFRARLDDVRMFYVGFAFRGDGRTGVREERLFSAMSNRRACLSGRQLQAERRYPVMAASNRCEARLRSFSQSPQQRPSASNGGRVMFCPDHKGPSATSHATAAQKVVSDAFY